MFGRIGVRSVDEVNKDFVRNPMKRADIVRWLDGFSPEGLHLLRRVRDGQKRLFARRAIAENRRDVLLSEPWFIDELTVTESGIRVTGWAFPPGGESIQKSKPRFAVNGQLAPDVDIEVREDVAYKFWQREGAELSGFVLRVEVPPSQAYVKGKLEISYLNSPAALPMGLMHFWRSYDPAVEREVPDDRQRYRVIGNTDVAGFLLSGATDFARLECAIQAATGRPFSSFGALLDWGSGCGRVARYSSRTTSGDFFGCDVDEENVRWCAANLPGQYLHTSMYPPLPFANSQFDLVYGISIFTHFREALQDRWLDELRRVTKPGGFALLTVHGKTAIEFAGFHPNDYVRMNKAVREAGIFVAGENDQLRGAVLGEEYVNVFHSEDYIRKRWSKWFSIVAVIPGYIFTHDLVILRRDA